MAATAATTLIADLEPRPVSYVVILADQLTWWMCDPAQRGVLDLPNIDRLRGESTEFERCYSTSPLCQPARATLRTGLFPHSVPSGVGLVQPVDTVEARLHERGLATRYLGKWHLSPPLAPGTPQPSLGGFVDPANRLNWDWFVGHELSHSKFVTFVMDDPTPLSTAPWDSAVMTQYAVRMMREDAAQGRPFFLHVNYLPPHQPYDLYPPQLAVYTKADVAQRPNVPGATGAALKDQAHYMNLLRGVDIEIGRLLDEIDLLEAEVVVIFTSDHGDMLGSQGETFKRKPWEEASRVPLMIRGPGWGRGRTIRYPVGLTDLAQTLAGIGQGIDLREHRDSVYYEMVAGVPAPQKNWSGGPWRALVTEDRWKLAIAASGQRLLYHLRDDPYELVDRAQQGLPREAELETRMREWAAATGDGFFAS